MRLGGNMKFRLLIGLVIAGYGLFKYYSSQETNPYTGKVQTINMTEQEEIAIGLQSAPGMTQQHGGLYPDQRYQQIVDEIGNKLVNNSNASQSPYIFDFHLLRDPNTINAFALPGGQIFITYALFSKLVDSNGRLDEDMLAGVLGHEIGHVLGKHSAERIAKSSLWKTLTMAGSVGADMGGLVSGIGNNTLLKNGRGDELESDDLGVLYMLQSGYNPEDMIRVMQILKEAAGPNRTPEFQSTHPDPENRIEKIRESIKRYRSKLGK